MAAGEGMSFRQSRRHSRRLSKKSTIRSRTLTIKMIVSKNRKNHDFFLKTAVIFTVCVTGMVWSGFRQDFCESPCCFAEEPPPDGKIEDYGELIGLLDSDSYSLRTDAQKKLHELSRRAENQYALAVKTLQALDDPETSFEVQHELLKIQKNIPEKILEEVRDEVFSLTASEKTSSGGESRPTETEADVSRLLQDVVSENFAARSYARRKLMFLAESPAFTLEILIGLRQAILKSADDTMDDELRLLELEEAVRGLWLLQADTPENTPVFTETQITAWVREITSGKNYAPAGEKPVEKPVEKSAGKPMIFPWAPVSQPPEKEANTAAGFAPVFSLNPGDPLWEMPAETAFHGDFWNPERNRKITRWLAIRFLEDALACEKYSAYVEKSLREAENRPNVPETEKTVLRHLLTLTSQRIAVEFWKDGRLDHSQILEIGVPQKSGTMLKASFFDKLDENEAHCASGNSLTEGFHPLNRALPLPKNPGEFFHIMNISSPRRQLTYSQITGEYPQERWLEIVRRTLLPKLERKEMLTLNDLVLLASVEPEGMVALATRFLNEMKDSPIVIEANDPFRVNRVVPDVYASFSGKQTCHTLLCQILGKYGTRNSVEGLLSAIQAGKTPACGESRQYAAGYIAAFQIAQRDPWETVDDWLLSQVENDSPLVMELRDDSDPMMVSSASDSFIAVKSALSSARRDKPLPEVGATAAAIWMNRHGIAAPEKLGLRPQEDVFLKRNGIQGYFFQDPAAREEIKRLAEERKGTL